MALQVSHKMAAAVEEQSKVQAAEWGLTLPRRPRGAAENGAFPWTALVRKRACAHCGAKGEFQMTCFPGAVRHPSGQSVSNLGYLCLQCAPSVHARGMSPLLTFWLHVGLSLTSQLYVLQ